MDRSGASLRSQNSSEAPPSALPGVFPAFPAGGTSSAAVHDMAQTRSFSAATSGKGQRFTPTRHGRTQEGEVFAAFDLGTNNCRLMLAQPAGDRFRVVDSYSRIVRLGEGLTRSGALDELAMGRTLGALRICAGRLARHSVTRVRAVATEACRRAINGEDFLARVHEETGLAFEIISAREEAELAVEGCRELLFAHAAPGYRVEMGISTKTDGPEWGLLVDIGGGSTEIAWVRLGEDGVRHEMVDYLSLPLGVMTLADLFPNRRPGVYRAMVAKVREHLAEFERRHDIHARLQAGRVRVVGTSGTVTTLASLDLDLPRYIRCAVDGYCLGIDSAKRAITRLHRMGMEGMRVHPCIGAERATHVMPGCAIFEALLSQWPTSVIVADRGLRDGMILRMMREQTQGTLQSSF
ncbi:Ppx/GppA family phosphatase [Acetobacter estunensis]|uniref:Ppx/GppA family phosphatase n=2 Tax=Acetobacter estunensis TaxID=104097 RepID=A0A967BDP9_9PROT|nr:Ppx/GppA family phosphatase [Acetobacter estunensis]